MSSYDLLGFQRISSELDELAEAVDSKLFLGWGIDPTTFYL